MIFHHAAKKLIYLISCFQIALIRLLWNILEKHQGIRDGPCEICEISSRLMRSRRDCRDLTEIAARYLPSRRGCRDHAVIVEISPWRMWHSKSRQDRGKISSISPRFVETSPRCFRNQRMSWWDLSDLAMIFVGFSNLVKFAARFSTSRQDWRDLAVKFDSFCILRRFWKTQTSYWDCQNITQSFPDGMNNFPPWI